MRKFGLIGYPLSHSFSQKFFNQKFQKENIVDTSYENFPIPSISNFHSLWQKHPTLEGLNVTIPYKKEVIPFLQHSSAVVEAIKACNCIHKFNNELYGYNTDVIGFENSLMPFLQPHHTQALILGTGGAAAAVKWVLEKLGISYQFVSRTTNTTINETNDASHFTTLEYDQLTYSLLQEHTLIINTSPLGMYPTIDQAPPIPYEAITPKHHLYDLIYNPVETLFMKKGLEKGATVQNGLEMLHIQAEESWIIWNSKR